MDLGNPGNPRFEAGWLGSSISPVTPPQRTYRMAIMPIPPASHRWWLCDEWVNPRKEWAQRDHLDADFNTNHAQKVDGGLKE